MRKFEIVTAIRHPHTEQGQLKYMRLLRYFYSVGYRDTARDKFAVALVREDETTVEKIFMFVKKH